MNTLGVTTGDKVKVTASDAKLELVDIDPYEIDRDKIYTVGRIQCNSPYFYLEGLHEDGDYLFADDEVTLI